MTIKITFLLILILSAFSQVCHARKPAVEEVRYLSIDEYREVNPKDAKGFQFHNTNKPEASRIPSATTYIEGSAKHESIATLQSVDISSPILWSLIILSFPIAIWLGISYGIKRRNSVNASALEPLANVTDIKSKQKVMDKTNFPKAS